ncbi:MAG: peroxisome- protein [Phylliscum demangeonii]|nr:MAG: peroxisome- protein [Phylliscum demangeonii]
MAKLSLRKLRTSMLTRRRTETPWLDSMASSSVPQAAHAGPSNASQDANPPTLAVFSPPSRSKRNSTILVQQKSPLLATTPPKVTRALAHSHAFLAVLSNVLGLITWTTDDSWASFLLLAAFWATALYGDVLIRWASPLLLAGAIVFNMYSLQPVGGRRTSAMSSTDASQAAFGRGLREPPRSFDEMVESLEMFTNRCNILMEPLWRALDFLSSQDLGFTSGSSSPIVTLLLRHLLGLPLWIILGYPGVGIITTRRVVITVGTLLLSWHSRSAQVSRAILWRSATVRRICSVLTGLDLDGRATEVARSRALDGHTPLSSSTVSRSSTKTTWTSPSAKGRIGTSPGVRFTFTLWENQRRWIGLGWTNALFAYERAPWTDDLLNAAPPKEELELPEVDGGGSRWRWAEGSEWRAEGATESDGGSSNAASVKEKRRGKSEDPDGWIYYDSKWRDGRRRADGWGRYTRRRRWYRDAELIEVSRSNVDDAAASAPPSETRSTAADSEATTVMEKEEGTAADGREDDRGKAESAGLPRKRKWFQKSSRSDTGGGAPPAGRRTESQPAALRSYDGEEDYPGLGRLRGADEGGWAIGDDAKMGLG